MRNFVRIIVAAAIALLMGLPKELVKDQYIHQINETIQTRTGWQMPNIERVLSAIFEFTPLLAAVGLMYLYHRYYESIIERDIAKKYAAIIPQDKDRRFNWESVASLFAIVVFVLFVLYYKGRDFFVPQIVEPMRFTDISRLSNTELRARALKISDKLSSLNYRYSEFRNKIAIRYENSLKQFDIEFQQFNTKKQEYEQSLRNCSMPYPLGARSGSVNELLFGKEQLTPKGLTGSLFESCPILDMPSPPIKPSFPNERIDLDLAQQMEDAQEEASSIWEALAHRKGTYTRLFTVPQTYNDVESGAESASTKIRNEANLLR